MTTPKTAKQLDAMARVRVAASPRRPATTPEILPRSNEASSRKRVPAKWRWHHRVLLSLHDRLLRESTDLRQIAAEPVESYSLNEADSASDEFDHDLALRQLSAEQDALHEVNSAIGRIADGTYGVCEDTGRRIPAARLRAVPWTRFTCKAAARLENQDLQSHFHSGSPEIAVDSMNNRATTTQIDGSATTPSGGVKRVAPRGCESQKGQV